LFCIFVFVTKLKNDSAALDIRTFYQETEFLYAEMIYDSYLSHRFHIFVARFMRIMDNVKCIMAYTDMVMGDFRAHGEHTHG
jgi:hypothetical protein